MLRAEILELRASFLAASITAPPGSGSSLTSLRAITPGTLYVTRAESGRATTRLARSARLKTVVTAVPSATW